MMIPIEDLRTWIDGMKGGRERAFESFINHFWHAAERVAARFVPSGDDREEWAELILLHVVDRILKGKFQLRTVRSFNAWLLCLAGRKCLELWRRDKRRRNLESGSRELEGLVDDAASDPRKAAQRGEVRRILLEAVESISKPELRETLQMVWRDEMSHEEIALKLNKSIHTIRTWDRRGRLQLSETLKRTHPGIIDDYY